MKKINDVILSTSAPRCADSALWVKPTSAGVSFYVLNNGKWQPMSGDAVSEALGEALEKEIKQRVSDHLAINTSINEESVARKTADGLLQESVNTEKTSREAADSTLQGNIDSEASSRSAADTTLQKNIDTEASERKKVDTTLQDNIDSEASARSAADTTLQGNIDTEISERKASDSTINASISTISTTLADKLESGDLKTINGESMVGSGDISIDLTLYKLVSVLPTEDIDTHKIYLVLNTNGEDSDLYTEYIYVNEAWEKLGEYKADIDLTPYLTVEAAQNTYLSKTDATATYQPKGDYLKEHQDLSAYAKSADVASDYLSKTDAASTYLSKTDASNAYLTQDDASSTYVKQADYDTKVEELEEEIATNATAIGTKADKTETETALAAKQDTVTNPEDVLAYGIAWPIDNPTSVTRVGNMHLHKTLPIQSGYRGCVAKGQFVQYYLDENDWSLQADGVTASRLDGYDGEVKVEIPEFYLWSKTVDDVCYVYISLYKCVPYAQKIPRMLVDAYRATVLNTVPEDMGWLSTLTTNSLVSVMNTNDYCRGGGNRSAYDKYFTGTDSEEGDTTIDLFRTDLGKPRTSMSRAVMRTYARNAGKEMLCYDYYKAIFYWAYVIEYGSFNSQATYNSALTDEGYRQGGLGNGLTTVNGTYWNYYNNYYSITPMGYGNSLGNGTGLVSMEVTMPTASDESTTTTCTFQMPRWRGFDNPFGDIWTNLDGFISVCEADSDSYSKVYATSNPDYFSDSDTSSMRMAGLETTSNGYTKRFSLGETGEMIPYTIGSPNVYDYHWTNSNAGNYTLVVGGGLNDGALAGLGRFHSNYGVGDSYSTVGVRCVTLVA